MARNPNKACLTRWLAANAILVLEEEGQRVYKIEGRQQPFTTVDHDGYVAEFSNNYN